MELEFEIEDYFDGEYREFGATLVVEAHLSKERVSGEFWGKPFTEVQKFLEIDSATLFTYDQDGGNSRELDVEATDYVSEQEIIDRLEGEY